MRWKLSIAGKVQIWVHISHFSVEQFSFSSIYTIELTVIAHHAIDEAKLMAQYAVLYDEIQSVYLYGVIAQVIVAQQTQGHWAYTLKIKSPLHLLRLKVTPRCLANQQVDQMVRNLLADTMPWPVTIQWRSQKSQLTRDFTLQQQETDYAVLERLLREYNMHYCFVHKQAAPVLRISDDIAQLSERQQAAMQLSTRSGLCNFGLSGHLVQETQRLGARELVVETTYLDFELGQTIYCHDGSEGTIYRIVAMHWQVQCALPMGGQGNSIKNRLSLMPLPQSYELQLPQVAQLPACLWSGRVQYRNRAIAYATDVIDTPTKQPANQQQHIGQDVYKKTQANASSQQEQASTPTAMDSQGCYQVAMNFAKGDKQSITHAIQPLQQLAGQSTEHAAYGVQHPIAPETYVAAFPLNNDGEQLVLMGAINDGLSPVTSVNVTENILQTASGHALVIDDWLAAARLSLSTQEGQQQLQFSAGQQAGIQMKNHLGDIAISAGAKIMQKVGQDFTVVVEADMQQMANKDLHIQSGQADVQLLTQQQAKISAKGTVCIQAKGKLTSHSEKNINFFSDANLQIISEKNAINIHALTDVSHSHASNRFKCTAAQTLVLDNGHCQISLKKNSLSINALEIILDAKQIYLPAETLCQ